MRTQIAGAVAAALLATMSPAAVSGAAAAPASSGAVAPAPVVGDLRVNALEEPLGIDTAPPALSWKLAADRRGVTQQAYEVHVASSTDALAQPDVWDSGKVTSDRSVGVRYGGPVL